MRYSLAVGATLAVLFFGGVQSSAAASCPLKAGSAYKTAISPAVYYVRENCTKSLLNQDQYFSYFRSWNETQVTSPYLLSRIQNDTTVLPMGPKYFPRTGSLVKSATDPKVYYIVWFTKNEIASEAMFSAMGLDWSWVETVPQATLDKFVDGDKLENTDQVFNEGIYLFHYSDNSQKTYMILPNLKDGGVRRHLLKNDVLIDYMGYRRDRIPTLQPFFQFPLGETIDNLETFFTNYLTESFSSILGGLNPDLLDIPSDEEWMKEWEQNNSFSDTFDQVDEIPQS